MSKENCSTLLKNGFGFGNPSQQRLFNVLPLSALDLGIAAGAGALVFVALELEKVFKNKKTPLVE